MGGAGGAERSATERFVLRENLPPGGSAWVSSLRRTSVRTIAPASSRRSALVPCDLLSAARRRARETHAERPMVVKTIWHTESQRLVHEKPPAAKEKLYAVTRWCAMGLPKGRRSGWGCTHNIPIYMLRVTCEFLRPLLSIRRGVFRCLARFFVGKFFVIDDSCRRVHIRPGPQPVDRTRGPARRISNAYCDRLRASQRDSTG